MWHLFREVPIPADVFPSRTVEAYDSSLGVCPDGAFVVLDEGGRVRCYTISFAVALDVAVQQDTDLVLKPISDPQTAIGERQQATHRAI